MSARRGARLLVGCALGTVLLAGCGDEPALDVSAVESYLAASQATTYGAGADVGKAHCAGHPALKEGMTVRCTLDVSNTSVPYRLTLHHVHARKVAVAVALDAVVLDAGDIGDFVRTQLPKKFADAAVDCGGAYVVTDVGKTVECTVSSGAQTQSVVVTVEDAEGHVSLT
ncbi:MAG TPA: hypothetical protein VFV89_11790 [Nocardioides sp.]|uniref:hypothetical protein n=1 Tax=Nocardioides sp. TaxID=35761 RepID=UPI002E30A5F2|nr:hypothetical protein [Nocardioides sp.]HEX5088482.1 hypothetical protein [Nocardioides sp.]